jgi:hypothetical protein
MALRHNKYSRSTLGFPAVHWVSPQYIGQSFHVPSFLMWPFSSPHPSYCLTIFSTIPHSVTVVRAHPAFPERSVQAPAVAHFHHLVPVRIFVLHKVDSLDDVHMVQSGRDAELSGELSDVFFLCLVVAAFAAFLARQWTRRYITRLMQTRDE